MTDIKEVGKTVGTKREEAAKKAGQAIKASRSGPVTNVVAADFVAGAVDLASLPAPTQVEIAFAGRSNVGKSSLLNSMLQRHSLARTSRTPGCTRQLNVFAVRCNDGLSLNFVDLPGYGWAKRSKTERGEWQQMIEGFLRNRASLRAVAILFDVRRGLEEDDRQLVEFLQLKRPVSEARPMELILVATKVDKVGAAGRKPAMEKVKADLKRDGMGGLGILGYSSVTGDGREELWARIRHAVL